MNTYLLFKALIKLFACLFRVSGSDIHPLVLMTLGFTTTGVNGIAWSMTTPSTRRSLLTERTA